MRVLVSGFNSFGAVGRNPSEYVVQRLRDQRWQSADHLVHFEVLDTSYEAAERRIGELIDSLRPDLVVMLGVAARRKCVALERVAINRDDCASVDNNGQVRLGWPIVEGGPEAYETTLAIEECCRRLKQRGVSAEVSEDAGRFVCNHVYYCAAHRMRALGREGCCVFVHLPMPAGEGFSAETGAMLAEELVEAVRACIEELAKACIESAGARRRFKR